jgi:hypothetical protein
MKVGKEANVFLFFRSWCCCRHSAGWRCLMHAYMLYLYRGPTQNLEEAVRLELQPLWLKVGLELRGPCQPRSIDLTISR